MNLPITGFKQVTGAEGAELDSFLDNIDENG
jgi:hypothetical protein